MPILETGQIFASGDQVTSQKLMDIAGLARFDDPADEVTIQVDTDSGKLKVPANGISGNELLHDPTNDSNRAVDTNHLKDESVTLAKLAPAAISGIMPTGSVMPFAGREAPEGFLVCDGSPQSRNTYSALFDVIKEIYGNGDGSTTFNLPDLRGRVVAGRDNMSGSSQDRLTNKDGGIDGDTLGATGGHEEHHSYLHSQEFLLMCIRFIQQVMVFQVLRQKNPKQDYSMKMQVIQEELQTH